MIKRIYGKRRIEALSWHVTTGVNTPFELIQNSKGYFIKDIIPNIRCSTLVLEAEKDDSFPGQPKRVYDALTWPQIAFYLQRKKVLKNIVNVVHLLFQTNVYLIGWMLLLWIILSRSSRALLVKLYILFLKYNFCEFRILGVDLFRRPCYNFDTFAITVIVDRNVIVYSTIVTFTNIVLLNSIHS